MRIRCHSLSAVLLALTSVSTAGKERISILDFSVSATARKVVNLDASQDLTQQVRDAATNMIDPAKFEVMTRENILVMLPPGKKDLSECEGQCEVETARNLGSRWHVVGDIKKPGTKLVMSIRLYDVSSGTQLSGARAEGATVDELIASATSKARELLARIPGLGRSSATVGAGSGSPIPEAGSAANAAAHSSNGERSANANPQNRPDDMGASAVAIRKADEGASGTFKDPRDGHEYGLVRVGDKVWMGRNLDFKANGSQCLEKKSENCARFGRQYGYQAAKSVCPAGWHLSTAQEWKDLLSRSNQVELARGQDPFGFRAVLPFADSRLAFFWCAAADKPGGVDVIDIQSGIGGGGSTWPLRRPRTSVKWKTFDA